MFSLESKNRRIMHLMVVTTLASMISMSPVDPVMHVNDECLPQLRSNGVLIGDWLCLKLSNRIGHETENATDVQVVRAFRNVQLSHATRLGARHCLATLHRAGMLRSISSGRLPFERRVLSAVSDLLATQVELKIINSIIKADFVIRFRSEPGRGPEPRPTPLTAQ